MSLTLIEISAVELEREFPAAETATKTSSKRTRPIDDGIRAAIAALWPDSIPRGLKSKDRDNEIAEWLRAHDYSVPSDSGLARAVQRAMKPRS
jgi:hypothetical protein